MVIDREQKYREMAMRGKYRRLYAHLCGLRSREWSASFAEVEAVLGFQLPLSARMHRPWWANQSRGNGHSHALAWTTAGWETAQRRHGGRDAAVPAQACRACCSPYPRRGLARALRRSVAGRSEPPQGGHLRREGLGRAMFVDTNILVNARILEAPHHESARAGLESALRGSEPLRISRQVMREYLAVVTRPQAWPVPITRGEALDDIGRLNQDFRSA